FDLVDAAWPELVPVEPPPERGPRDDERERHPDERVRLDGGAARARPDISRRRDERGDRLVELANVPVVEDVERRSRLQLLAHDEPGADARVHRTDEPARQTPEGRAHQEGERLPIVRLERDALQ